MFDLHISKDRGLCTGKGLISYRSFSDGDYFNFERMGFSVLQSLNQDYVLKGNQFPVRKRENIEVLTYVLKGTLIHTDDLGNQQQVPAGDFQLLSAGAGIEISESNGSVDEDLHFIEVSIIPNQINIRPGYQQRSFQIDTELVSNFELIASPNPGTTAMFINQDAQIYRFRIEMNSEFDLTRSNDSCKAYIHLISGTMQLSDKVNIVDLKKGDGVSCSDVTRLGFFPSSEGLVEGLLFILPSEY